MKKSVILVGVLLFLSACQYLPGGVTTGGTPSSSQGLVMRFLPNLPPTLVYDTEQIGAQLEITNRGQYSLGGPGDTIYLSGFDQNIVTGVPTSGIAIPKIDGVSDLNPQGNYDYVTFDNMVIRRIPTERFPVRMLATACYGYQTKASASVCLDPLPNIATLKTKVCSPTSVSLLGQAAPVTVASIRAEPRKGVTTFRITVSNSGGGTTFKNGVSYLTRCNPNDPKGLGYDEVDYVQVLDVTVGGQPLNCKTTSQDGHVRLNGGQAVFTCDMPVQGNDAYSSPMTITLAYGYQTQLATQFDVVHTP